MNLLEKLALRKAVKNMFSLFDKILKGKLGSKTIFAAVALVALVFLQGFGVITQDQFDSYTKVAEALGLVGLRDAFTKIKA